MGLTPRPIKNIDLSKIDDIQNEFFSDKTVASTKKSPEKVSSVKSRNSGDAVVARKETLKGQKTENQSTEDLKGVKNDLSEAKETETANPKIAELLATAKFEGVRHTSRPFTVPRSLTIDLNRLKTKFRARDLQYTQNELMDKMIKESLETVTADNYFEERERAFRLVKSPEQCSRRSVTLMEETASEMAELKAGVAHKHNRRVSSDEIFTTLLAVAFASLYENALL